MGIRVSRFALKLVELSNILWRYDYKEWQFADDDTNIINGTSVTSEHLLQDEDKRNRHIAQTMTSPNDGSEYQKDLRYFET